MYLFLCYTTVLFQVDIFSFSMVLYEILSGERPYNEYKNMAQISRAMKVEAKRPKLEVNKCKMKMLYVLNFHNYSSNILCIHIFS